MPGKPSQLTKQEAARRQAQSQKDKRAYAASLTKAAKLPSIREGLGPLKKDALFQGAVRGQQLAPRGLGYYNAFKNKPDNAILSQAVGPATMIEGYTRELIPGRTPGFHNGGLVLDPSAHLDNSTLIVFNGGSSDDKVAMIFHRETIDTGTSVHKKVISLPQFEGHGDFNRLHPDVHAEPVESHTAGPGVESIPLRASIKIRNVSEALSRGGIVRFLRFNGSVGYELTASSKLESLEAVEEMIRSSGRTQTLGGEELVHGHCVNTYPADFVRSNTFSDATPLGRTMEVPSYCTLFVLIDNFRASTNGTNNSYEVEFKVQRAARFPPGTLLHSLAKTPVVGDVSHVSRMEADSNHAKPFDQVVDFVKGNARNIFDGVTHAAPLLAKAYKNVGGMAGKLEEGQFLASMALGLL